MEFRRKNTYISLMVFLYTLGVIFFAYKFNYIKSFALSIFNNNQILANLALIFVVLFFTAIFTFSLKFIIENNKTIKIQKVIGKYLSKDIVGNLIRNTSEDELKGKKEYLTILFADIRNFTSLSETMSANSVSEILNEYFDNVVPIIEENNGILNKFIGDAILAIFKEENGQNSALNAIKCSTKMLAKTKKLQEKWAEENKPKISIGIGISSGEVFIGNIGAKNRLEYTVIGDTVNTASRIENYNKIYKTNILISQQTYEKIKNRVDVITINNVSIKGKANKINLYEVVRLN